MPVDDLILAPMLSSEDLLLLRNMINQEDLRNDVRRYADPYLDPNPDLNIRSRHIRHGGNAKAVRRLEEDLRRIDPRFEVSLPNFDYDGLKLHNVEAVLPGEGLGGAVFITAHLDSTAAREPAYQPQMDWAPGADDDASGIAGVLAAARVISKMAAPGTSRRDIRFVLFNAEEARQAGSVAYLERLKSIDEMFAFHMDMIAHDKNWPRMFEIHAGFGNPRIQKESIKLAQIIARMVPAVSSELCWEIYPERCYDVDLGDPAEGFSDHTSFHRRGIPACLISEDFFPCVVETTSMEPNPDYHLQEDTVENLNFEYAADIARVVAAAAWYRATR